jgi:hypothetical protein
MQKNINGWQHNSILAGAIVFVSEHKIHLLHEFELYFFFPTPNICKSVGIHKTRAAVSNRVKEN